MREAPFYQPSPSSARLHVLAFTRPRASAAGGVGVSARSPANGVGAGAALALLLIVILLVLSVAVIVVSEKMRRDDCAARHKRVLRDVSAETPPARRRVSVPATKASGNVDHAAELHGRTRRWWMEN